AHLAHPRAQVRVLADRVGEQLDRDLSLVIGDLWSSHAATPDGVFDTCTWDDIPPAALHVAGQRGVPCLRNGTSGSWIAVPGACACIAANANRFGRGLGAHVVDLPETRTAGCVLTPVRVSFAATGQQWANRSVDGWPLPCDPVTRVGLCSTRFSDRARASPRRAGCDCRHHRGGRR